MAYGSVLGQTPPIPDMEASNISYDNATSQLTATNVQAAIDEIVQNTSGRISVNGTLKTGIASEDITEGSFVVEGGSWLNQSTFDNQSSNLTFLNNYALDSNGTYGCFYFYNASSSTSRRLYCTFYTLGSLGEVHQLANSGILFTQADCTNNNCGIVQIDELHYIFAGISSSNRLFYSLIEVDLNNNTITQQEGHGTGYSVSGTYGDILSIQKINNSQFVIAFTGRENIGEAEETYLLGISYNNNSLTPGDLFTIRSSIFWTNNPYIIWPTGSNTFTIIGGHNLTNYHSLGSMDYQIDSSNNISEISDGYNISEIPYQNYYKGCIIDNQHIMIFASDSTTAQSGWYVLNKPTSASPFNLISSGTLSEFENIETSMYNLSDFVQYCNLYKNDEYIYVYCFARGNFGSCRGVIRFSNSPSFDSYNLYLDKNSDAPTLNDTGTLSASYPGIIILNNSLLYFIGDYGADITGFTFVLGNFIYNSTDTISGISAESASQGETIDYYVPN